MGMEVQFTPDQETQLNEMAAKTGRGTDELVREAVDRLFAYNQWFRDQVQVGLDQIKPRKLGVPARQDRSQEYERNHR